jgi:hypothetical protein
MHTKLLTAAKPHQSMSVFPDRGELKELRAGGLICPVTCVERRSGRDLGNERGFLASAPRVTAGCGFQNKEQGGEWVQVGAGKQSPKANSNFSTVQWQSNIASYTFSFSGASTMQGGQAVGTPKWRLSNFFHSPG